MSFSLEVIVSTYRNPEALDLALASLAVQRWRDFSICVAEDAEEEKTAAIVSRHGTRHVFQADLGFRKNRILNEAIRTSQADYLIFLDGDCLAHPGFVARHVACAHRNRYMSGGVVRLSQSTTDAVAASDIRSQRIWQKEWLHAHGVWQQFGQRLKLMPERLGPILDRVSLARKRWLGGNASTFRDNLVSVNGFDESLDYGAEDKELGVRLENAGIRPYSVRYSAPVLHLEHERDYVDTPRNKKNQDLLVKQRKSNAKWTVEGLKGSDSGAA